LRKPKVSVYTNPWLYKGQSFDTENVPEWAVGFVYLITNKVTGKRYIGRKILQSAKRTAVGGKIKRFKVDSDWKKYYGSSAEIKEDVIKTGKENFERSILHLCRSKSEMAYLEAKEIFESDCLIRDDYYNSWITCRINGRNLKPLSDDWKSQHASECSPDQPGNLSIDTD
jgi:hypothetical protein